MINLPSYRSYSYAVDEDEERPEWDWLKKKKHNTYRIIQYSWVILRKNVQDVVLEKQLDLDQTRMMVFFISLGVQRVGTGLINHGIII